MTSADAHSGTLAAIGRDTNSNFEGNTGQPYDPVIGKLSLRTGLFTIENRGVGRRLGGITDVARHQSRRGCTTAVTCYVHSDHFAHEVTESGPIGYKALHVRGDHWPKSLSFCDSTWRSSICFLLQCAQILRVYVVHGNTCLSDQSNIMGLFMLYSQS